MTVQPPSHLQSQPGCVVTAWQLKRSKSLPESTPGVPLNSLCSLLGQMTIWLSLQQLQPGCCCSSFNSLALAQAVTHCRSAVTQHQSQPAAPSAAPCVPISYAWLIKSTRVAAACCRATRHDGLPAEPAALPSSACRTCPTNGHSHLTHH